MFLREVLPTQLSSTGRQATGQTGGWLGWTSSRTTSSSPPGTRWAGISLSLFEIYVQGYCPDVVTAGYDRDSQQSQDTEFRIICQVMVMIYTVLGIFSARGGYRSNG